MNAARFVLAAALLAACSADVPHESPYDTGAPLEKQARGQVTGRVALEGETDAGQVDVVLQNASRTYSVATGNDGAFRITGVVPGAYELAVTARYFTPVRRDVVLSLGDALDLGDVRLAAVRASVVGAATIESLNAARQTVTGGGVTVTLTRTASVRTGAKAPAFRTAAAAEAATTYTTISGADGAYRVEVPVGVYAASAAAPGVASVDLGAVTVTGDEAEVALAETTLRQVSGYFDIVGQSAGAPSSRYTQTADVTLRLSGFGAETMALGRSSAGDAAGCVFGAAVAVAATATYTLPAEGENTVCVKFFDAGGRATPALTGSIIYDKTPPAGASLAINDGAAYASSNQVTLALYAADATAGVGTMEIATDAAFTNASVLPYAPVYVYALTGTGAKTVYARFIDRAGNRGAAVSKPITVDTTPPTLAANVVDAQGQGVTLTNKTRVYASLTAGDDNPASLEMLVAQKADFSGAVWAPYRATVPVDVDPATLPAGNTRTIYVKVRDGAGHVVALGGGLAFTVDTVAPTAPSIAVAASQTGSRDVSLTLGAQDATRMELADDAAFSTATNVAYAASAVHTVPAGDGPKTIYARFLDAAGNASPAVAATVLLDTLAPQNAVVTIDGGAAYVTNYVGSVTLTFTALDAGAGLQLMRVANLGGSTCAAALDAASDESFSAAKAWLLASPGAGTEGRRWVCARFADKAGNWSAPVSATTYYDALPPAVTGAGIHVNGDAAYATQTQVEVAFEVSGAVEMLLGNDGSFAGANWEPYRAVTTWFLPDVQGSHLVGAKFRDAAGNEVGPSSTTISLDSVAPSSPAVAINGGAAYVNGTAVTLTLGAVGADWVAVSNDGVAETLYPYTTSHAWALTGGDGLKQVFVRYLDLAGNTSAEASAIIELDGTPPANGSVIVNGGNAYTNATALTLALSSAGATKFVTSEAACPASTVGGVDYAPTITHTLPAVTGAHVVYYRFGDDAGNLSACSSFTANYDPSYTGAASAALAGGEGIAGRTRSTAVTVSLTYGTDAYEMRVANDSGFTGAAWSPVTASVPWVLASGDGTKTVYVRYRDRAGNQSALQSPTIVLDTAGPSTPGLQLSDLNADGFALSQNAVEMRWTTPSDPNLDHFELQRLVEGVDGAFTAKGSFVKTAQTYTDWVTVTTGYLHHYKLRAVDDLGNASDWSLTLDATPFAPVAGAVWLRGIDGDTYVFSAQRGTFSLLSTYGYEDSGEERRSESLPFNVISWQHAKPADLRFNESLSIRSSNQDNGLVYDSKIPLPFNTRETLDKRLNSYAGGLALDDADAPWVCNESYGGNIDAFRRVNGAWQQRISSVYGYNPECAADRNGNLHILAAAGGFYGPLHHLTLNKASGSWSDETLASGTEGYSIAVDAANRLHVAYVDGSNNLHYAVNAGAGWSDTPLGDPNAYHVPRLALDANGAAHLAVYGYGWITYFSNETGSWASVVLVMGGGNSDLKVAVGPTGKTYLVYTGGFGTVYFMTNESGAWTTVNLVPWIGSTGAFAYPAVGVATDGRVDVVFRYWDTQRQMLVQRRGGVWGPEAVVDGAGDQGNFNALAERLDGSFELTYANGAREVKQVRLGVDSYGDVVTANAGEVDAVIDANGRPATAYYDTAAKSLKFRRWMPGGWKTWVVDASSSDMGKHPSLGIDAAGAMHVAYYDAANKKVQYATNAAGSWAPQTVSAVTGRDIGDGLALAVTPAGKVYLAYNDAPNTWSASKVTIADNLTGTWRYKVVDTEGRPGYHLDLTLDAAGTAHLVYAAQNGSYRMYAKGSGTTWTTPVMTGVLSYTTNRITVDDATGKVYTVGLGNYWTLDVCTLGGAWGCETLGTMSDFDYDLADVALDLAGNLHLAYYDVGNARLRYAANVGGQWYTVTLDQTGSAGRSVKLVRDAAGGMHAFYIRVTTGELVHRTGFAAWLPAASTTRVNAFQ